MKVSLKYYKSSARWNHSDWLCQLNQPIHQKDPGKKRLINESEIATSLMNAPISALVKNN